MADTFDYDVFLSHNRADKDWVRTLAARIECEKGQLLLEGRDNLVQAGALIHFRFAV